METALRMTKINSLDPVFVDAIPEGVVSGKLYISIEFATSVHKCCCGCGMEVVTPFSPTDWKLTFDGVSVSLTPSVGNWSFPCRSHYWITNNAVRWAEDWSQERIETGRAHDRAGKGRQYGESQRSRPKAAETKSRQGIWSRLKTWFLG